MIEVMLLVSRAGPGISQNAGDTVSVSEEEARRMFAANQAEPVSRKETAIKKQATRKAVK